ncbi:MAG: ATP-binding protein [Micromonosporaceae bacterium]
MTTSAQATPIPAPPERPAIELSHTDSLRLLRRQTAVLELLASGAPLPAVLTSVAVALEELIDGARCSILLLDPMTATLRHGAAPTLPDSYAEAIDGMSIGPDAGSCGAAAYLGCPVVAEDITADPRWDRFRALALPYGLRSCWSSPICGRTGTTGTFAVYHEHVHQPTQRERGLVEHFTHLASVAIDHASLFGALAESEERFRHAFEDSAVGMALTDLNGRFLKVNRALREMLRQPEAELLVTTIDQVLAPTESGCDPAELLREVARAARESVHFEAAGRRSDGTFLRVAVAASVVHGAAGSPVHLSLNLQDVTQRHAAERERRARREAEVARGVAEAASRAKSGFLTDLSHELRTPLQAITGFTELLGTLDLPVERRRAALSHIQGATAHIISLVDDVLDIAKIEAGALPVQITDVDLAGAIQDVLDLLTPLARERGIMLRYERPAGTVRADGRRLRQVLINLVTNAIRYNSPSGNVQITADQHRHETIVRVTDSGPGIAPELLGRLFVPFDRLGAEASHEHGTGLGLSLAQGLTQAMGAQLMVESHPQVGTTFAVVLSTTSG